MTLLSWKDFLESRPITRAKTAAAFGLAPMPSADVFGHATPTPFVTKKLLNKLKQKYTGEPPLEEKEMRPDYSFDRLIRKATSASQEIDKDIEKAGKESDRLDKEKERKEKQTSKRPIDKKDQDHDHEPQPDEKDSDKVVDKDDDEGKDQIPVKKPFKHFGAKKPNPTPLKNEKIPGKDNKAEVMEWLSLLGNTSFDSRP